MDREQLLREALAKLQAYLKTGLEGFRQQGMDRLVALGVNVSRCDGIDGARHLVECLENGWIG